MKKLLSLFMMLLMTSMAWADDAVIDGINYYIYYNPGSTTSPSYAEVQKPTSGVYTGAITIPEYVSYGTETNIPVTKIKDEAFKGATITSVNLPLTLEEIKTQAFDQCASLTSITFPEGIRIIGQWAFRGTGISSVTFPGTLQRLYYESFAECPNLTSATMAYSAVIPDDGWFYSERKGYLFTDNNVFKGSPLTDLTVDRPWYFTSYSSSDAPIPTLKNVTFGDHATTIVDCLFKGLTLDKLVIGSGVTEILDYTFVNCTLPAGVNIPFEQFKTMGSWTFRGCTGLPAEINLAAIEEIGSESFYEQANITTLTLGPNVKKIGNSAFNRAGITKLTIEPGALEEISSSAFSYCDIHELYLPNTVKKIGGEAFAYCENLTIPNDLPEGLLEIGTRAFYNCKKLNVNIPSTVTKIDQGAFSHCESMEKVVIPAGVTYLSMFTFMYCKSLKSLTIPGTLLSMSTYEFSDCDNLTEVRFEKGDSPLSLGKDVFDASPVKTLYIDRTINATYENDTFRDVENVEFGPNCTEVGTYLFRYAEKLQKVTMPDNVKTIANSAFVSADINGEFTLSKKLETIGDNAFQYIGKGLTSFTFPITVNQIGEMAFERRDYHEQMTDVYVPWLTPLVLDDDDPSRGGRFNYTGQTLWVPGGTMDLYKAATIWSKFEKFDYWSFVVNASVNGKGGSVLVANGEDVTDNGTNSPITAKAGTPANGLFVREKTIKLAPTADKGYEMSKVVVNGSEIQKEDGIFAVKNLLADQTIEASFTPIVYNLTYDLAGGKLPEGKSNPATYTIEDDAITLVNPVRDGYDFAGWTGTDLTEPTMTVTIAAGSTEDRSYTATWKAINYNLSYDLAGGALPAGKTNPATYTIESDAITLVNPVRDGYEFAGWTGTGLTEATKTVVIAKGSTNKRDYTATWTPVVYAITYDLDGGALAEGKTNPETYTIESENITLNNPTREGYDFAGWTGTGLASATVDVTIAKGSKDKREYKATWTGISYQVEFDANGATGGTAMANQNFVYGTKQKLNANTYSNGTDYIFYGWNTQNDGKGKRYKDEEEVENLTTVKGAVVTLYAEWRLAAADNTYKVRFDANGGEGTMADQDFTYLEEKALTKNTFTRTGYTFAGWNTKQAGGGSTYNDQEVVSSLTPIDKEIYTIYAQWSPIKYAVQFDANGGTGTMADQGFEYDEEKPLTKNTFQMEGYNFDGWNTQADGKGEKSFTDEQKVKNLSATDGTTVTLYAQYEEITYTINFDPGDTKLITATVDNQNAAIASGKIENVYKNKTVVLTAAEGYVFGKTKVNGGAVEVSFGTGGKTAEFTMPMGDVTVTYSLQRNLAEGMKVLVGNGTMTKYRVQQDAGSGKWAFTEGLTELKETILDEFNGNLDLTAQIGTDFTSVLQKKADNGSWEAADVATEGYAPGTYRFLVSAISDAYANETTSTELSVYFGYEFTLAPKSYATYYSDEAVKLDGTETDAQLFTVASVSSKSVTLSEPLSVVSSNTPFLIYNSSDAAKTVLLLPAEEPAAPTEYAPEFKGTLAAKDFTAAEMAECDHYVLSGNKFIWVRDAGTIGSNLCWLELGKKAAAARSLSINGSGTTGINSVDVEESADSWYDMNGRKLDEQPARKGVYIQNGKKVVVK